MGPPRGRARAHRLGPRRRRRRRTSCARPSAGSPPLEAAAVPGPALALDALHDALAPAVRARPDPARVAVAMSGGVDSAVALLEARAGGREAVGVTLRLWTDPAGPDGERACCSPAAVVAARETCHALGVPHVTLDLRERFREAVVAPFVAGYEAGETPNPCVRCNGSFRFGELLAFARRVGAARLATGHYARLREHRGRLLLARAADPAEGPVLHARAPRPAPPRPPVVPAGRVDEGGDAGAGTVRRPRRGRARGEPGGVLPRRRRLPRVPRAPRRRGGGGADRGR